MKKFIEINDHDLNREELLLRLGAHVAKLRKSRGYSQDRLQLEANLSRGALTRIEKGERDARASTLIKIALTLGVPPSKILDFKI